MKHNSFTLNNENENGMVSKIEFDGFKTRVSFGFNPGDVEYKGKISLESLKEIL